MKKLPQQRHLHSNFAAPDDGETVDYNPPSLQWIAEPGAAGYRVTVRRLADGKTIIDGRTPFHYFCFDALLEPGEYAWNVFLGDSELGERRFRVAADARPALPPTAMEVLKRIPPGHPRHIYYPGDLAELRRQYAPQLEVIKRNVEIAIGDGLMSYPDYYKPDGRIDLRRTIDEMRVYLDRDLVACALAHLFLGDKAAAKYVRAGLLRFCEWNPAGPCATTWPRCDEVGLSLSRCLPAVIDWTFDLFDEAEQRWLIDTLHGHARQTYRRLTECDYLANPGDSHMGRMPGYLGEAAMVLWGHIPDEEAAKYLDYAIRAYSSIFPHYGGRGGGWAEGVFYGSSYTQWYLPFFFALERHSSFSFFNKPFYRNLAEFFVHFATPGFEAHPFGDGNWPTAREWPGFQAQNPFGVYAERFGSVEAREFSRRCIAEVDFYRLHLLDVIPPLLPAAGPAKVWHSPNHFICRDTGMMSLRRAVGDPEHDVALLARCSRYGTPSHQHADQGSFALLVGGKALLAPTGSFGYLFGTSHHDQWTRQTKAQNAILVDGEGQLKSDAATVGRILEFSDENGIGVMRFDLSEAYPMLKSYIRELRFDRAKLEITVTDEIDGGERPRTIDFRLHSYAAGTIDETGRLRLERAPGAATIRVEASAPLLKASSTDRFRYPDDSGPEHPSDREMPAQFHYNWRFAPAAKLRIVCRIQVEFICN